VVSLCGLLRVAGSLSRTSADFANRTGMIGTKHGIFPSNYVKMKE
jgi:hypothetical protein